MDKEKDQLWSPASGIRFSPEPHSNRLYPALNFNRFIHSSKAAGTASEAADWSFSEGRIYSTKMDVNSTRRRSIESDAFPNPCAASEIPTPQGGASCKSRTAIDTETVSTLAKAPAVEPPITSLDFNMSKKLFQSARASRPGTAGSYFSHTMYESTHDGEMPRKVKVHYCTSKHTMEHVCKKYFADVKVLGFDMEWLAFAKRDSGPRENVSLIQLASQGRIGLFHVAVFPKDDFVAPTFQAIMENDGIRKVGVHIQADCTRLRNYLGVHSRGVFELSHLYKLVKHTEDRRLNLVNKVPVALAAQVQDVLRLPLYKGQSVRASDWTRPLSTSQLLYSASDAYCGLQIFHVLDERRKTLNPQPELPHHAELGLPIPVPTLPTPPTSDSEAESVTSGSESPATRTVPSQVVTTPRDARIVAAEAEAAKHRASRAGKPCAAPAALRSYFIWASNSDLEPASIAKLLRDPPLQTGTVICYILDSILVGKLPYPRERLQKEVLSQLHVALANGRYQRIVQESADSAAK